MKKEIADKWVTALRSGKYEQGTQYLSSKGKFCCLGVLCDIAGRGRWRRDTDVGDIYMSTDGTWSTVSLPYQTRKHVGMKWSNGYLDHMNKDLASLNDDGVSFTEIADIIEQHWEEL